MEAPTTQNLSRKARDRGSAWTIEALGLLTAVAAVGVLIAHPEPLELWALDFAVAVGFPGLLVLTGYWIGTSELAAEDRWKIATGAVLGFVVTAVLGLVVSATQQFEGGILFDTGYVLITFATFGAFVGTAGTFTLLGRRVPAPLSSVGLTDSEVDVVLEEIESGASDEYVRDWFATTVIDDENVLQLRVIEFLRGRETGVTRDDVVTELLDDDVVPEDWGRERVHVALHHTHLPMLEEAGVLSYDPDERIVRPRFD